MKVNIVTMLAYTNIYRHFFFLPMQILFEKSFVFFSFAALVSVARFGFVLIGSFGPAFNYITLD